MEKLIVKTIVLAAVLSNMVIVSGWGAEETVEKLNNRVREARLVLEEMQSMPDQAIPSDLLKKCSGIAIFPSVLKGGFGIGGMYGQGILMNRDSSSGKWSSPLFMSMGGASIGFQIGGQATDMILVVMNERGVESLSHNNVTLGGDVSVAAGPVGRDASMDTDATLKAGIFSYSRSKGLFAGVSLKGAAIGPMKNLNKTYYGQDAVSRDILFANKAGQPEEVKKLINFLKGY